jgi:hypothetical protein
MYEENQRKCNQARFTKLSKHQPNFQCQTTQVVSTIHNDTQENFTISRSKVIPSSSSKYMLQRSTLVGD